MINLPELMKSYLRRHFCQLKPILCDFFITQRLIKSLGKYRGAYGFPTNRRLSNDGSSGRSMIEMLGVLAIIGVLSVGSMTGYQKAMIKHKLNKQSAQLGSIIDYATIHADKLKNENPNAAVPHITTLLKKLNAIPPEMIKNHNRDDLQDAMGNHVAITFIGGQNYYFSMGISPHKNRIENCLNLYKLSKEYSKNIWHTLFVISTQEVIAQHTGQIYGDNYCTPGRLCLKNLEISQMRTSCKICENADSCLFMIIWK